MSQSPLRLLLDLIMMTYDDICDQQKTALSLLAEYGADMNERDDYNEPLSLALVRAGKIKSVRAMLENGADANAATTDDYRDTALHICLFSNECKLNNIYVLPRKYNNYNSSIGFLFNFYLSLFKNFVFRNLPLGECP